MKAILKICHSGNKNAYKNKDAVEKVINYVLRKEARDVNGDNIYGRIGSLSKDKREIIKDFKKTKKVYNAESGVQIKHLIISFRHRPFGINKKKMADLMEKTVAYFGKDYQVVYAVHEDKTHDYHIHIAVNSVSNYGKRFDFRNEDIIHFKKRFNKIWNKYGCEMEYDWNKQRVNYDKVK